MNGRQHTIGGLVGGPLIGAALATSAKRQPTVAEFFGWVGGALSARSYPTSLSQPIVRTIESSVIAVARLR